MTYDDWKTTEPEGPDAYDDECAREEARPERFDEWRAET